jgi:hypothetical protein
MRGAVDDAAEPHRAGLPRVVGIADLVLLQLAGPPARHIEPPVVDREVDVGDQRRHRPERLQGGRQLVGLRRLGGDRDRLPHRPALAVAIPKPHRGREVLDADHDADEPPRLARVVGRSDLEHHLLLLPEVDPLDQPALGQLPEVEVVAESLPQQVLGVEAVLDHRRRRPLGGHRHVVVQVPPDVVGEVLLAAVALPGAGDLERVVVDQRHAARAAAAVGGAQVRHEDASRAAVDRVRA